MAPKKTKRPSAMAAGQNTFLIRFKAKFLLLLETDHAGLVFICILSRMYILTSWERAQVQPSASPSAEIAAATPKASA
jgi:hypothetical protein